MPKSILIVEDEDTLRESLKRMFLREGFSVDTAESAEAGLELIETSLYDVIISDIILPSMDGIEFLGKVKRVIPDQIFIVMTAYASLDTAVKALRSGAYDYIVKPVIHEEIKQVVRNATSQRALRAQNTLLKRQIGGYGIESIIGRSSAIKRIIEDIKRTADAKSNILLLGETGTGKELFARVIHQLSARREMPFVPINCSAIPENLLESELFGHLKGAFTGAVSVKKGLLEEADGGTVFLDEIGELPSVLQAKILRVLEDHEIRPLGGTKSRKVDLRFIAATNRDLADAVKKGLFREDLFYRINVIAIEIPPLRERPEDIEPLLFHYLERYSGELGKHIREISPEALRLLTAYRWPGNVRELQNAVERAVLIADGPVILPEYLPASILKATSPFEESLMKGASIEDYTRAFIIRYQGTLSEQKLASMLGITRKSLWEKRKKWGLQRP